ncbi:MAG: hypothetical protein ABEJ99_05850 [Candidatus Nanohaloarchaea archaeon]
MDTEISLLAAIVLAILIVAAVFTVAQAATDQGGTGINELLNRANPDKGEGTSFTANHFEKQRSKMNNLEKVST